MRQVPSADRSKQANKQSINMRQQQQQQQMVMVTTADKTINQSI
jgi:hypothetical protein